MAPTHTHSQPDWQWQFCGRVGFKGHWKEGWKDGGVSHSTARSLGKKFLARRLLSSLSSQPLAFVK